METEMYIFRCNLGLYVHCWFYMYYSFRETITITHYL